ncbi:hypothetical protein Dimus_011431 [Dionaea muscipula]
MISKEFDKAEEQVDELEDDALSLCDLPISSSSVDHDYGEQSCLLSQGNDDDFEFFPSTATGSTTLSQNILTADLLIPELDDIHIPRRRVIKKSPASSPKINGIRSWTRQRSFNEIRSKMESYRKLSSKSRSRWHWLILGSMRLPGEMELDDIKSRQSRSRKNPRVTQGHRRGGDDHEITRKNKAELERGRPASPSKDFSAGNGGCRRRGIAMVKVIGCMGSF